MRTIERNKIGDALSLLIDEQYPEEEDIGILNEKGVVTAVVITPQAYAFFLRKVDEEDEKLAIEAVEKFDQSGEKDQ